MKISNLATFVLTADEDLKEYAKDEQFLLFVIVSAILLNTGLPYLSLIVSAQIREHQFVNRVDVGDIEAKGKKTTNTA